MLVWMVCNIVLVALILGFHENNSQVGEVYLTLLAASVAGLNGARVVLLAVLQLARMIRRCYRKQFGKKRSRMSNTASMVTEARGNG